MSGRRRNIDPVVARPFVRAAVAAIVLSALGNLILLGCFVGWLGMLDPASPFHSALWLMVTAAVGHFTAGAVAMLAWAWTR